VPPFCHYAECRFAECRSANWLKSCFKNDKNLKKQKMIFQFPPISAKLTSEAENKVTTKNVFPPSLTPPPYSKLECLSLKKFFWVV
jgi:hypothetical protein